MKKIIALCFVIIMILSLTACEITLTENDIKDIINKHKLNILNFENCGFNGREIELNIKDIIVESSSVRDDDGACDVKVVLENEYINAEVFYRFDLKYSDKIWNVTSRKNHKKFTLNPIKGIDDASVLNDVEKYYDNSYKFEIDSNIFDKDAKVCNIAVSYVKKGDVTDTTGILTAKYIFNELECKWALEDIETQVSNTEEWSPEGDWRFNDGVYYYKVGISNLDGINNTLDVSYTVSEYESVIDTAEFQTTVNTSLTLTAENEVYVDPITITLPEDEVTLMLSFRADGMYFLTDNTSEYTKTNLPRKVSRVY